MRATKTNQKGMTLIEVLVSIAITGMLVPVLPTAIFQFIRVTEGSNICLTALDNIQSAYRWISHDGQMAQTTNLVEGAEPVSSLTLTWTEWDGYDGVPHACSYSLSGSDLQRNYDGNTITVARYISDIEFSLANRIIEVKITSSPSGNPQLSEQKVYHIGLRPAEESSP